MSKVVTEQNFRQPQYVGKNPDDYEFRRDGVIVRKDRWESAVRAIADLVGLDSSNFEIDEVVSEVEKLVPIEK